MPLLLVDERDGLIVAELQSEEEALRILAAMAGEDERVPDYLTLVDISSHRGSVIGTDTSVTIRVMPR